jgi:arylamine N-acetyltransferase
MKKKYSKADCYELALLKIFNRLVKNKSFQRMVFWRKSKEPINDVTLAAITAFDILVPFDNIDKLKKHLPKFP